MSLSEASYRQVRFRGRSHDRIAHRGRCVRRGDEPADAILAAEEQNLAEVILASLGLTSANYRSAPLRRRITAVLRAMRTPDLESASQRLVDDPRCARQMANTLLIGHTAPFRDINVFDTIRRAILPLIMQRSSRPLRVWSLGCSTGEELLSLALLLVEAGIDRGAVLRGSDCRADAIVRARKNSGAFLSSLSAQLVERYTKHQLARFSELTESINWNVEDALSCEMSDDWDIVLCRNFAIYLTPSAITTLWNQVANALSPDGFLVTGKAERPRHERLFRVANCIYQHRR